MMTPRLFVLCALAMFCDWLCDMVGKLVRACPARPYSPNRADHNDQDIYIAGSIDGSRAERAGVDDPRPHVTYNDRQTQVYMYGYRRGQNDVRLGED